MMTEESKNAAMLIEVAVDAIDKNCQAILNLAPREMDLQDVPPAVRADHSAKVRTAIGSDQRHPATAPTTRTTGRGPPGGEVGLVTQWA
jgi:hypothetical protein